MRGSPAPPAGGTRLGPAAGWRRGGRCPPGPRCRGQQRLGAGRARQAPRSLRPLSGGGAITCGRPGRAGQGRAGLCRAVPGQGSPGRSGATCPTRPASKVLPPLLPSGRAARRRLCPLRAGGAPLPASGTSVPPQPRSFSGSRCVPAGSTASTASPCRPVVGRSREQLQGAGSPAAGQPSEPLLREAKKKLEMHRKASFPLCFQASGL